MDFDISIEQRANVPAGLTTETTSVDPTTWGAPSAAYPSSSCDMGTYFGPQQVVIDVTLCGQWYVADLG